MKRLLKEWMFKHKIFFLMLFLLVTLVATYLYVQKNSSLSPLKQAIHTANSTAKEWDPAAVLFLIHTGDFELRGKRDFAPLPIFREWIFWYINNEKDQLMKVTIRNPYPFPTSGLGIYQAGIRKYKLKEKFKNQLVSLKNVNLQINIEDIIFVAHDGAKGILLWESGALKGPGSVVTQFTPSGTFITNVEGRCKVSPYAFTICGLCLCAVEKLSSVEYIWFTFYVSKDDRVVLINASDGTILSDKASMDSATVFLNTVHKLFEGVQ